MILLVPSEIWIVNRAFVMRSAAPSSSTVTTCSSPTVSDGLLTLTDSIDTDSILLSCSLLSEGNFPFLALCELFSLTELSSSPLAASDASVELAADSSAASSTDGSEATLFSLPIEASLAANAHSGCATSKDSIMVATTIAATITNDFWIRIFIHGLLGVANRIALVGAYRIRPATSGTSHFRIYKLQEHAR